mmetsp:Transcript_18562/g.40167  ORF Transcript_18562/g.40167 Transcript_18562/m.40167 type:complete len:416 (+) Transcript_18562:122-1369(+)
MKSTMKLLSSKKSSRPTSAPQHPPKIKAAASVDSSELLQLRLENSELRNRLDDALSNTDETKSELLQLLEEQTSQTNLLQSKCDTLAAGFVDIDKERRALRKSANDARNDAMQQVDRTREEAKRLVDLNREECDSKCEQLERHLKMREKEVEKMAERVREQERRIEGVVLESNGRQATVEELEGELEDLIGMVESERDAKKKLEGEYGEAMGVTRRKDGELDEAKLAEEELERQLKEARRTLQEEENRGRLREEQLKKEVQGKEADVANVLQDQQLSKIEHEQAMQTMQDEFEAQRKDFESQHQSMTVLYQSEKAELINVLHDKSNVIQNLTSEMGLLQSNHVAKVSDMENVIQQCKEGTRAVEITHQQSLETASQLQQELNNLRSTHHIAQEELKAAIICWRRRMTIRQKSWMA